MCPFTYLPFSAAAAAAAVCVCVCTNKQPIPPLPMLYSSCRVDMATWGRRERGRIAAAMDSGGETCQGATEGSDRSRSLPPPPSLAVDSGEPCLGAGDMGDGGRDGERARRGLLMESAAERGGQKVHGHPRPCTYAIKISLPLLLPPSLPLPPPLPPWPCPFPPPCPSLALMHW